MIRLNYRPEIDSLRAIAVLGVIIYHAKLYIFGYQFFTGGYLGVDIFFVISGYLIFSLIYKELQIYNKLDFKNFYERRARRILPALIFVILVSFIFSWKLILPTSFIDYSKSVIYSLVFSSNFYFFFSGQLYGAESGLLKPLLHTWSLSVEEQFYIIFPLFTLLFFKYLNKYIFYLFIFISILSFALSQFLSIHNPSLNFYFLTSRIWEVLCGAMLVFFENKNKKTFSNLISNFFVFIGLVLIILSFLLI
ncbi:acyltransferase, partial [Candidatus Pelagibacter sp.]|nr:acyltransferase [Candidatus Pelagibacter sp.]